MKKFLIFLVFIISIYELKSKKIPFYAPLDARIEAMGSIGMIFGKEHGALFYAPTAVFSTEGFYAFKLPNINISFNSIPYELMVEYYLEAWNLINAWNNVSKEVLEGNASLATSAGSYFRIGSFVLGLYLNFNVPEVYLNIDKGKPLDYKGKGGVYCFFPISYSFNINSLSFGFTTRLFFNPLLPSGISTTLSQVITGTKNHSSHQQVFKGVIFNGITFDTSVMYNSSYGIFALSLNNVISYLRSIEASILTQEGPNFLFTLSQLSTFMPNLKLGYGREFDINFLGIEKIKVALELDNLLMQDLYLLGENDYNFGRKINLGFEMPILSEEIKIDLRGGVSNLFPTLGFGFNFSDIFKLDYAFFKKLTQKSISDGGVYINSLSFSLGYF